MANETLTEAGTLVRVRAGETDEVVTQEIHRLGSLGVACVYFPSQEMADAFQRKIAWNEAVYKAGVKALQAQEKRRLRRMDRLAEATLLQAA